MSNGSGHRAVRPSVNGQRQENDTQASQEAFFRDAAAWIMKTIDGKPTGKPPSIPATIPGESEEWEYYCRPSLNKLFEDLRDYKESGSISKGQVIKALHNCLLVWQFTKFTFESLLSELKKNGFDDRTITKMIADEVDPGDSAYGDKNFDGVVAEFEAEIAEAEKAKKAKSAPAESVANMADEKSARTAEKPAKGGDTFAKMFDWIGRLKIPASRRLLLAELARAGHDCPAMTWVGNSALAEKTGVLRRQVQRTLKLLESAGYITIRNYRTEWCKTQRVVFINRFAERAGVDPKAVNLPPDQTEFFRLRASIRGKLESAKKAVKPTKSVTKNTIGCHTGHPIVESTNTIGCHIRPLMGVMHDTRRDNGFSAPKGAEKTHTPIVVSTSPPKGVLPPTGVEETTKPAPSAKPVPGSEHAAVEAKKVSTARPPMDWPERNLPTANRESVLARMVRLGRVTHLHPRWLDGLACWVVRCRKIDGQDVFLPPKSMDDGWIVNTVDTVVVPLIDPENRRVSQDEFRRLIATGPMVAPDLNKPVVEPG